MYTKILGSQLIKKYYIQLLFSGQGFAVQEIESVAGQDPGARATSAIRKITPRAFPEDSKPAN